MPRADSHNAHDSPGEGRRGAGFKRLGKYELIARIGKGGMAQVYLARQRGPANFEKMVVVKTIHPHLAAQASFIDMLLDEARIAALLKHPCVVDIYDLGLDGDTYFIAMEYLRGEPLLSVLRAGRVNRRPLDVISLCRIIADVADGLHAAHELKDNAGHHLELVHRDVTPGNIVVLYNGQVKIVDFGIAKAQGRLADATDARKLKGKLGYVAPEQVKGQPADRRADIFALGVVMWESLTYRRLFRGSKPGTVLAAIVKEPLQPPSSVRADVPPALDAICMKALARDPNQRYATAQDMYGDIEEFLAGTRLSRQREAIAGYMRETFAEQIQERERILREMHESSAAEPQDATAAFAPVRASPDDDDDEPDTHDDLTPPGLAIEGQLSEYGPGAAPMPGPQAQAGGRGATSDGMPPLTRGAYRLSSDDGPPTSSGEASIKRGPSSIDGDAQARRRRAVILSAGLGLLMAMVVVAVVGSQGDNVRNPAEHRDPAARIAAASRQIPEHDEAAAEADREGTAGDASEDTAGDEGAGEGEDGAGGGDDDTPALADSDQGAAVDGEDGDGAAADGDGPDGLVIHQGAAAAEQPARGASSTAAATHPSPRPRRAKAERSTGGPAPSRTRSKAEDHKRAAALYGDGVSYFVKGEHAAAQLKFREAVELAPGFAKPHRGLGLVYEATGQDKRAVRSFRTYLRLAPKASDRDAIQQRIKRLGG
ncbi:protein kinase domain-containing protein [Haliangium sp.]|uniref:protein kinase domain-containing protein n=1 Tax=Haliangium sp. TaxID=2663208 RepID=UPI003D0AEF18